MAAFEDFAHAVDRNEIVGGVENISVHDIRRQEGWPCGKRTTDIAQDAVDFCHRPGGGTLETYSSFIFASYCSLDARTLVVTI